MEAPNDMADMATSSSEPRQSPARSWFAASRLSDRVEELENMMQAIQMTAMTTLPRDVQDIKMSMADISSRQNAVEMVVRNYSESMSAQLSSLAEVVDEHSNAIRDKEPSPIACGSAEHFLVSTPDRPQPAGESRGMIDQMLVNLFNETVNALIKDLEER